jgi:hypothetical protein
MKSKILFVILGLAILAGMTFFLLKQSTAKCQLCLEFNNQNQCSEARGPTEKDALEEAQRNACAIVSSGVTDTLACHRTTAKSTSCGQ